MEKLERILSRPVAKPYRSNQIERDEKPYLNDDGHVDFAPDDVENPKNWSAKRRWYITVVAIILVLNATFASSAPSGALAGVSAEFGVSRVASGLVITLFLLGYCFGPLFFAPLSEFFGRRWIFYGTFFCYVLFNFLCAWAPNFGALLAGRFITGTFASAPLSNAPGVLADLWGPVERGIAMAMFACITFAGPAIGPVIAGFLELKETWRWVYYVLLWLGAGTLFLLVTFPETHPPTVLTNKAKRIRKLRIPGYENVQSPSEAQGQSLAQIYKIALTRPWMILFDTISFLVAIYLSITYCLLYMLFTIYPIVFRDQRRWNAGVSELPLLGSVIGACIGGVIVLLYSKRTARLIAAGREHKPEHRLPLAMIGGIGFAITMFWFGWSANFISIHWIVPTLAGVFLATSIMLIFVSYLNYLTDSYLTYAASAVAANTITRSAAGAAAPLFTGQMFRALGIGGGASLIGAVATILAIIPFMFYKYGEGIRRRSRFAPTSDPGSSNEKDDEEAPRQDEKNSTVVQRVGSGMETASSSRVDGSSSASSETIQADLDPNFERHHYRHRDEHDARSKDTQSEQT